MRALLAGLGDEAARYVAALDSLGVVSTILADERAKLTDDVSVYDVVICNGLFQYNDILRFTRLKYVQVISSGLDRVPVDYIQASGIVLQNARGLYSVPMAETVICGLLDLYRKSRRFARQQDEHLWLKCRDLAELAGRSVCIVGAGSVGQEVARRLKAFDTAITGIARRPRTLEHFDSVVDNRELDSVLPSSDIVVLTLPLNDATVGLFNAARINLMKPGSVLVNVSRGGLVDERALCNSLVAGHLGGAILDVFEVEPLPQDSPLWEMKDVIITPHNSFVSDKNADRLFDLIITNLTDYLGQGVGAR